MISLNLILSNDWTRNLSNALETTMKWIEHRKMMRPSAVKTVSCNIYTFHSHINWKSQISGGTAQRLPARKEGISVKEEIGGEVDDDRFSMPTIISEYCGTENALKMDHDEQVNYFIY